MSQITLETTADKYLITVDRTLMDKPTFRAFFERLRLEVLADKMNTDETDIMVLSEEIKTNWWVKHQTEIEEKIARFSSEQQS